VNFNPLIKLDGYYLLSDYLEIPNLRARSKEALWSFVYGRKSSTNKRMAPQVIYALLSIVFSTSLLLYVYSALYTWATSTYALAGLIGFMMFSTYTLRRTASESVAGIRALVSRAAIKKYRNAGIAVVILLIALLGRWELKIPAEFKVIARSEITVRPETKGVVVEMLVREGAFVKTGDVLARLRDFDKQQRISELSGELQKKRNELALLVAGARPEEIDGKRKLIETKQVELLNARRNQEQRNQLEQTLERRKSELHESWLRQKASCGLCWPAAVRNGFEKSRPK
jgi:putative peptide zinc metalloprotease protein